jgi:hypothetical protein
MDFDNLLPTRSSEDSLKKFQEAASQLIKEGLEQNPILALRPEFQQWMVATIGLGMFFITIDTSDRILGLGARFLKNMIDVQNFLEQMQEERNQRLQEMVDNMSEE